MSLLADSSTIFRALATRRATRVAGESTLDLARYEIGNAILKERKIFKALTAEQAKLLAREGETLLRNMTLLPALNVEEILELAMKTGLSFYDTSYLYTARREGLKLATEDTRLSKVAGDLGIITVTFEKLE